MSDIDCPLTFARYEEQQDGYVSETFEFTCLCIKEKCALWIKISSACSIKVKGQQSIIIANALKKIENHLGEIVKGVYR